MATLQDLKAEIAREINLLKNDEELEKIGHERKALEAELKELRFKRRYKKVAPYVSGFKTAFGTVQKAVGTMQKNQADIDRQNKAIRKKGFKPERRGLFE